MKNYHSVLGQLQAAGLKVSRLEIGGIKRCRVEGDREQRGWYVLHDVVLNGDSYLVGSYGIWHGAEKNAMKIEISGDLELDKEQKAAIRARLAEDKRMVEAQRQADAARAAKKAESVWLKLSETGDSDYLTRKGIGAYGIRFNPATGAIAVPMRDQHGIKGLQFILSRNGNAERIKKTGRDKEFWPAGLAKKGAYHVIGHAGRVILICEGYATGASLHAATGFAVVVAFDAGNLQAVAEVMRARYPRARLVICADDDNFGTCAECKEPVFISAGPECPACGKPHKRKNSGIEAASLAALAVNGSLVAPRFSGAADREGKYKANRTKLTDFNDLHLTDGLASVNAQIEAALQQASIDLTEARSGGTSEQGGGDSKKIYLKPIATIEELLNRFSMVLHMGSTVFDAEEHCLARMTDMADACQFRHLGRQWKESPDRKIIRRENVGFDPTEKDPNIICNLWAGWPTQPKSGKCKLLLELLEYMCLEENNSRDIFEWILKWLAYPIQNPGAKMKSTIVIHGLQGTGKNLFFETIMAIYGRYGAVIDQNALEDKFTDWASAKLFLIADETIAKHELYHIKNRLKSIITGDWIRINLKNKEAYNERNHVNMVFLSNERMPVTLEADDRRHCVIWIPQKLGPEFYLEVAEEIRNGGREALHYYLLNEVDLTGFSEHTKPPMTEAKKDLIELSKDSINRFHDAWTAGEIDVGVMPTLTEDVYELYRTWCGRQGSKAAPLNKVIDLLAKNGKFHKTKKRYRESNGGMAANISNPRALLIPTSAQPPVDKGESDWLGDCVSAFRAALTDYKAGSVIKSEGF